MNETPGEEVPAPFMLKQESVSEEEAFKYFTVIKCRSLFWDILLLNNEGNQRASCQFNDAGEVSCARWLAP